MKTKTKTKKKIFITLLFSFLTVQTVYATWSSYGTFNVGPLMAVQNYMTNGNRLYHGKTTNSTQVSFSASAKTMTSTPAARIVNNVFEARSSWVNLPNAGSTYSSNSNSGSAGSNYYLQVRSAINQIGTDSITIRFNPN